MAVPLDGIRAVHHAFRKDMEIIDEAANKAARNLGGLETVTNRYIFFNEILVWHADGEEEFVFPAVDKAAPLVPEPYVTDHRGLDRLFGSTDQAVKSADLIDLARATSAFRFHLNIHLDKEEAHLYRLFNERISMPDQAAIVGGMSRKIPQERFPEVIAWLFPLIGNDDRENMLRIWQKTLPAPVFGNVTDLAIKTIGAEWGEMTSRIPELR